MPASIASLRVSAECTSCRTPLITPQWSEPLGASETIHIWNCPMCGNEFETIDNRATNGISNEEIVEEFFPSLLVA